MKLHEGLKKIFMGEAFSMDQNQAARAHKKLEAIGHELMDVEEDVFHVLKTDEDQLLVRQAMENLAKLKQHLREFLKSSGVNY
jgi:hypothetical protein